MRSLRGRLQQLTRIRRREYHPLIHKIHIQHKISKKTLFYVKEYGPHSNVAHTIIRESIKVLLLASVISSLGGLALEEIKLVLVAVIPLVVLLPTLNDMVGDYGTIVASHFSTMLHEGKLKRRWWVNQELKTLFFQVFVISIITTLMSTVLSFAVAHYMGYSTTLSIAGKVMLIALVDVMVLVTILFLVSVYAGLRLFKEGEDPSNFLIPVTTAIADYGNMLILSFLVVLLF